MTTQEINDRLMTGVPCCGQCGEWLKGSENYCPACGAQQTDTMHVDSPPASVILADYDAPANIDTSNVRVRIAE